MNRRGDVGIRIQAGRSVLVPKRDAHLSGPRFVPDRQDVAGPHDPHHFHGSNLVVGAHENPSDCPGPPVPLGAEPTATQPQNGARCALSNGSDCGSASLRVKRISPGTTSCGHNLAQKHRCRALRKMPAQAHELPRRFASGLRMKTRPTGSDDMSKNGLLGWMKPPGRRLGLTTPSLGFALPTSATLATELTLS